MILEPAVEIDVVGDPAEQRHRGVAMRVDEPWQHDVPRQVHSRRGDIAFHRFGCRQHVDDPALVDQQAVLRERVRRPHRQKPAGVDLELGVNGNHDDESIGQKKPRRTGAFFSQRLTINGGSSRP